MQPNQQDPYQPPTAPPSPASAPPQVTGYAGANVPDFLGLEPLPEPKPPRSKKKLLIILGIILLTISIIGGSVYWLLIGSKNHPYNILNTALSNLMNTPYVKRSSTSVHGHKVTTLDISSDLSLIRKPKSSIIFNIRENNEDILRGEQVVLSETDSVTKIAKTYDQSSLVLDRVKVQMGQWYDTSLFNTSSILGSGFGRYINTPLGFVLLGVFDENERQKLVNFIKSNRPYEILDFQERIIDGVRTGVFSVKVHDDVMMKLIDMGKNIVGATGKDYVYSSVGNGAKVEIHVDLDARLLRKTILTLSPTRGGLPRNQTVVYDYPPLMSVVDPRQIEEVR